MPFLVLNDNSRKCLDIQGGSTANGAYAIQYDCHGRSNQQWYYETHPTFPYAVRIINGSGKCLAIGNGSLANGAKAIQWDCYDTSRPGVKCPYPTGSPDFTCESDGALER